MRRPTRTYEGNARGAWRGEVHQVRDAFRDTTDPDGPSALCGYAPGFWIPSPWPVSCLRCLAYLSRDGSRSQRPRHGTLPRCECSPCAVARRPRCPACGAGKPKMRGTAKARCWKCQRCKNEYQEPVEAFGLLKGKVPPGEFDRHKEGDFA